MTRASTGKLPIHRSSEAAAHAKASPAPAANAINKVVVSHKATPEEIKEKMEQQLRIQRAAHHHKRALEMQKNQGKRSHFVSINLFQCLVNMGITLFLFVCQTQASTSKDEVIVPSGMEYYLIHCFRTERYCFWAFHF